MSTLRAALLACLTTLPATAQDMPPAASLLSGAEFDRRFSGKTVYFDQKGAFYGIERYNRDRTVTWQFNNGTCEYGTWWEEAGAICFSYETTPDRQICWWFFDQDGATHARVLGDPAELDLTVDRITDQPMSCKGPMVGA